jgi:chemotaxis protein methyltransferase CheR
MDVIFCRNVIIYFDLAAKKRVVENFYQRLRPEGFLLLGHSESLMSITNAFVLRHYSHDMVYQRPPQTGGGEWR